MNQSSGTDDFEALLSEHFETDNSLKEGRIVKGHVVKVGKDFVVVDIGHKSEGEIPISQFADTTGLIKVGVGQDVDVFLENLENESGLVELSKEKADKLKVWDEISSACERDEIIEGTISQRVKGGLSVTIRGGVKAFLPGSQVDLRPIRNLERLIGETHRFKVIKFNKKRGNIVLSRRALLEQERDQMKEHTSIGARILEGTRIPLLGLARDIALNHHEKWTGGGYPAGLSGEAIPFSARIVAVCDVYDALVNDRVYRRAIAEDEALAIMREGRGSHFDPRVFDLFLEKLPEIRVIRNKFAD